MAHSEFKRIQLDNAGLLPCYDAHNKIWHELALKADRHAREALSSPLPDDVVDYLLPALSVQTEFSLCLGNARLSGKKWYLYFAEYILHREWGNVIAGRKTTP